MRIHTRMLLGALTAALVLASAVNTASARNLSVSNQNFRIVWTPMTLASSSGGGGITLACNVTLEGSFHYRTIVKVARSLMGFVTKAAVTHPCAGAGEGWADNGVEEPGLGSRTANTLPWHITYEGFTGRLPIITGIRRLLRLTFTINIGILCRYSGNVQGVINLNGSGEATTLTPDATIGTPKISGGILCPGSTFFTARPESSNVTLLGAATRITITLI